MRNSGALRHGDRPSKGASRCIAIVLGVALASGSTSVAAQPREAAQAPTIRERTVEPAAVAEATWSERRAHYARVRRVGFAELSIGVVSLALGLTGIFATEGFNRGAAASFAAFGAVHTGASVFFLTRTSRQLHPTDPPADFGGADPLASELAAVERRRARLRTFHLLSATGAAVGLGVAIAGEAADRELLTGLGVGFSFQCLMALALSMFNGSNLQTYDRELRDLNVHLHVAETDDGRAVGVLVNGRLGRAPER